MSLISIPSGFKDNMMLKGYDSSGHQIVEEILPCYVYGERHAEWHSDTSCLNIGLHRLLGWMFDGSGSLIQQSENIRDPDGKNFGSRIKNQHGKVFNRGCFDNLEWPTTWPN